MYKFVSLLLILKRLFTFLLIFKKIFISVKKICLHFFKKKRKIPQLKLKSKNLKFNLRYSKYMIRSLNPGWALRLTRVVDKLSELKTSLENVSSF